MRHPFVWCAGRVLPESELRIPAVDRTFEHGLGLFETLRTWHGRPTLLVRHLRRLAASAEKLGLPLDPSALPGADDVATLLEANRVEGDALLRITLTGGLSAACGSTLWMRSGPLPAERPGGIVVAFGDHVMPDDLLRHKTLNYWRRRRTLEDASRLGADESLQLSGDRILEGCRSNLFVVRNGIVTTPDIDGSILPGIMRGLVCERCATLQIPIREEPILALSLLRADEVFLTNAVRGIIPVRKLIDSNVPVREDSIPSVTLKEWPDAPGQITRRLRADLDSWASGEGVPF